MSAFIYESPTYSGGSAAIYQNPNRINPVTGESQIIVNSSVTVDGALVFAPEHSLGSSPSTNKIKYK